MSAISILFFSGRGHTTKLAEAIHEGAASIQGTQSQLVQIEATDIQNGRYSNSETLATLDSSDAIIFGSPTYMGGPAAQFKAFADATGERWQKGIWRDKIAAGFTVSSGLSGDKFNTLLYFVTLAMQHGMIWVGFPENPINPRGINRLGAYIGVMAQAGEEPPEIAPNAEDKLSGNLLGRRVALVLERLKNGPLPS